MSKLTSLCYFSVMTNQNDIFSTIFSGMSGMYVCLISVSDWTSLIYCIFYVNFHNSVCSVTDFFFFFYCGMYPYRSQFFNFNTTISCRRQQDLSSHFGGHWLTLKCFFWTMPNLKLMAS